MNNDRLLYRRGILQLVASGFFLSTSGIALRIIEQADGWQILFYRSLALSVTILLILVFQKGSRVFDEFRGLEWNDYLLALFLGSGFVAYVFALLYNTVANALFIFSCAPFVAGFLGWILLGERVATRTWFAIGGAMAGLTVMVGSELAVSRYLGTLIALWIPIAYAASIIVIRSSKRENMLAALCLAGLVSGGLSAIFVTDYALTLQDLIISLYLGVFQAGVGFTLVVLGTRYIPAAQVGLLAMVEPVLAPIWVWMGVGEVPGLATIVGGAIIFSAITIDGILNIKSSESHLT
jgi:drug/metabolite transporter (DMT)-like permease|tara:strand:+ start:184 stop:1065 length:882 start_codon:yes stop_codon:yes gene_type:complete